MKKLIFIVCIFVSAFCVSCKDEDHGVLPPIEGGGSVEVKDGKVTVNPSEFTYAIRNPMKGFREFFGPGYDKVRTEYPYPYGSLIKEYMQWNMLEDKADDGIDKMIAYSNHRWEGVEDINVKIIPRIYIVWMEPWHGGYAKNTYTTNPDDLNGWHWPSDIPGQVYSEDPNKAITGGYFDPSFQDRVKKLVEKAGQAWDNDPRVAYVEMGIIGEFGEQHDPDITTYWPAHDQPNHVENRTWVPGIEKVLGDAFTKAFKNKKVMVRYAYEFKDYEFGIYWDSWSADEEKVRGYEEMKKLGDRWKKQPIGGEITWNWGSLAKYKSFEEVVGNETTRDLVVQQIRDLHCNHLGGITWADFNDQSFIPNADMLQRIMGYRFLLSNFSYPTSIKQNEPFDVSFDVVNTGSSPFYYDWPVEIALLDAKTHQKVWSKTLSSAKISQWMPGDKWDNSKKEYTDPAAVTHIEESLTLDTGLDTGDYIISVAILDPAGMLPSVRFAIQNYFEGGRHPMGHIGVNAEPVYYEVKSSEFMDMRQDRTLKYKLN
ncbi:DUF4832 domain-containing protein [Dysgonomonas mossii]|uniref:DUF4832 domain-containing protein n=1 Tax=Dysgonomonas mossii TaxID=163665 RepID=UPI0039952839